MNIHPRATKTTAYTWRIVDMDIPSLGIWRKRWIKSSSSGNEGWGNIRIAREEQGNSLTDVGIGFREIANEISPPIRVPVLAQLLQKFAADYLLELT